jgi:hypothetical protein
MKYAVDMGSIVMVCAPSLGIQMLTEGIHRHAVRMEIA